MHISLDQLYKWVNRLRVAAVIQERLQLTDAQMESPQAPHYVKTRFDNWDTAVKLSTEVRSTKDFPNDPPFPISPLSDTQAP